jgi:hypothetical protein
MKAHCQCELQSVARDKRREQCGVGAPGGWGVRLRFKAGNAVVLAVDTRASRCRLQR